MSRRIVIAGASLAGLRTAEALAAGGWDGEVVIVGGELHGPYSRPPLTKSFLLMGGDPQTLLLKRRPSSEGLEWRLGHLATSADLDRHEITLTDGETIEWDALVIATGVSPRRIVAPGPTEGRQTLRTLDESVEAGRHMQPGKRIVVIGAGFIGCEVAASAAARGCAVDVVSFDKAAMQVPLGVEVGAAIQRRHAETGVRFHTGRTVKRFLGENRVLGVELDDGTVLESDLVIEAVGSLPNTEWLEGNGLDLANGVLTDDRLRAGGRSGVVVAGDVARFPNVLYEGAERRVEHWQVAGETARAAAKTVLADLGVAHDEPLPVSILPSFWSDQGPVRLQSLGMPGLATRVEVLAGELHSDAVVGYLADDQPVALFVLGAPTQMMAHRSWLTDALPMRAAVAR